MWKESALTKEGHGHNRKLRLLSLVVICVVPLIGLGCYLAFPSVVVQYAVSSSSVSTFSTVTQTQTLVSSSLTGYSHSTQSWVYCNTLYVSCQNLNSFSTYQIQLYGSTSTTRTTTQTSIWTYYSWSGTSRTLPPYVIPERGAYTAVIVVIGIIAAVLLFYGIVFLLPKGEPNVSLTQKEVQAATPIPGPDEVVTPSAQHRVKPSAKHRLKILIIGIVGFVWFFPINPMGLFAPSPIFLYLGIWSVLLWIGSIFAIILGIFWRPKYATRHCAKCNKETEQFQSQTSKKRRMDLRYLWCQEQG